MRTIALSLVAVLVLGGAAPARSAPDDHAGAIAALADMRAAIAEIVRIEDGYAVGHAAYLRAAHRAMNALVGRRDDGYAASFGDPDMAVGRDQHHGGGAVRAQGGHLGGDHAAHAVAHEDRVGGVEGIGDVPTVQGEVEHVLQELLAC